MPFMTLPQTTAFVRLSLLDGGSFIADTDKLHADVNNAKFRMYNWAFCLSHGDEHILWDLGLNEDRSLYTPWVHKFMLDYTNVSGPRRSIKKQLSEKGISPDQIQTVIFSHAHWDHCRPIREEFPNATAFFGPGTKVGCSPGHLADPNAQWDGRFFDPERATERSEELTGPWQSFGPFKKAQDYFGDGSFWIIQAPGHLPGNLCAAARLESGDWVLLGSDCCHSRGILDGTHEIAQFCLPHRKGTVSLHADLDAAKDTISKIRTLEKDFGFHVALAHDAEWLKHGSDPVLMSLLDTQMQLAARERIPKEEVA
ncbi:Metallo-hydrolase/oxidoreductase [Bimuria novae-zelandiae CBS 107.79]|uniref:Metallo-hydrolase/oxidoreductase n=1 Tax=Bimuria novae-zelandiae CBS 107.79 TaxID=1447943 RepID=A0A6A5VL24_9PLEO|nr:Metallo-hydrolase/oxidoreductase [Bimuria novae-zelandiae CBS 107.79]